MRYDIRLLKQRVRESRYAVDDRAVAQAIVSRARARLTTDRAEVQKHLAWLEQQIQQFRSDGSDSATPAPARSLRRATARRASNRRATARSHQEDTKARIVEFVTRHPGSTAGDLAKGLNLKPASVSMRLNQLAKAGEITKQSHGYRTAQRSGQPGT
jgi:predicted Rossmann fold nucleotide-binding protein DprA/Smf involved in DNA uptake